MPLDKSKTYSIQDLATEFNITPRTLRHYEEQGLISPERQGQTRIYHMVDRSRLAWILRGKRVGFSLTEVGEMLDLYDISDGREKQRAFAETQCRERIHALKAQRDDINATIVELEGFCDLISNIQKCEKTGHWLNKDTGEIMKPYKPE